VIQKDLNGNVLETVSRQKIASNQSFRLDIALAQATSEAANKALDNKFTHALAQLKITMAQVNNRDR